MDFRVRKEFKGKGSVGLINVILKFKKKSQDNFLKIYEISRNLTLMEDFG